MQDRVELLRRLTLTRESMDPNAVGHEQMIKRAVNRFEKGATVGAIIGVAELRLAITQRICPGVITREHLPMRQYTTILISPQ
jgi:hypothetical protein